MKSRSLVLAALSGALLAATFPSLGLWPLAWFALIPLFFALNGATVKTGFWLGALQGIVFFAGTVYWVTNSVHFYGNIPLIPAILITLLLCAYLAIYPALFGAGVVLLQAQRPIMMLIAVPALWTALELARTYVFSGFPWALLGYSQYRFLPVIQISDLTGVYGISFLLVLTNVSLALFLRDRRTMAPVLAAACILSLVLVYGIIQLRAPQSASGFTVSVVQGNIEQDRKWDPAYQQQTISTYRSLTTRAVSAGHPELVIWPETSTPFYFGGQVPREQGLSDDLRNFVKEVHVPLLFGSPTYEVKGPQNVVLRNSAFLLSANGDVAAKYDKFHLVPFGEYVPLKSILFFVEKMVQAIGDFGTGTEHTIMTVQHGNPAGATRFSTVICYEIIFPDLVRQFAGDGAGIITTITNDAWFGRTAAPLQHFSMAVFRAVENRVPIARAANTGISGFIDDKGHILAASQIFTEAFLTETLHPSGVRTFYTRFGDIFSYLCCFFSAAVLLPGFLRLWRS